MNPEADTTVYSLLSGVDVRPFDASFPEHRFLVCLAGRQFAVTGTVARLLEILRERDATPAALASELRHRGCADANVEGVGTLVRSLWSKGIVRAASAPAAEFGATRRDSTVRLRRVLIRPEQVRWLTAALAVLFRPAVCVVLLAAAVVAHLHFYVRVLPSFTWALHALPVSHYLILMALTTATTLWHELGHAAACRHYGCSHGAIGWGVYLFTPVFYTDVSSIWRLPRRQRAVVDIAGVYAEAVAAVVAAAAYGAWGSPLLVYVFLLIDLSILTQLTPILRRDGYWIVSDLTGHTHLHEASLHLIRGGIARRLGRRAPADPAIPPIARGVQGLVLGYTVVSVGLTLALFAWIGTGLVGSVLPAIGTLSKSLATGSRDAASLAAGVLRLALHVAFVLLTAVSALRFARLLGLWLTAPDATAPRSEKEATR